ncbi:GPP34 family phosphoprotein [Streptomyces sp. NPDC047002]|uniref:GOLPH3/VPS74 family protein n=1 Tax=Streptomyces sp. NPDC047002 TaxID=3155475 RepID=UPI003452BE82
MKLTLPQRLYLLCYTVDKEKFHLVDIQGRGQLLRAGALTELALAEQIRAEDGKALRLPEARPWDAFLAGVWQDVPADKPHGWLSLVHNKAAAAERPVRDQLAEAGLLTVESGGRFRPHGTERITVEDPEAVRALQEGVRATVLGGGDPATAPMEEAAMAVLSAEVEVGSVLSAKERHAHRDVRAALADRVDTVVPGLAKALRGSYLSSRSVGGGYGG